MIMTVEQAQDVECPVNRILASLLNDPDLMPREVESVTKCFAPNCAWWNTVVRQPQSFGEEPKPCGYCGPAGRGDE